MRVKLVEIVLNLCISPDLSVVFPEPEAAESEGEEAGPGEAVSRGGGD